LSLSAPSVGNNGSVDIVANLGITANEALCSALTPDPTTSGAQLSYLRGMWCGSNHDKDPVARATFGLYKGNDQQIYFRELY
jgi:MSHA biogenesis protein MshQ